MIAQLHKNGLNEPHRLTVFVGVTIQSKKGILTEEKGFLGLAPSLWETGSVIACFRASLSLCLVPLMLLVPQTEFGPCPS